MCLVIKWTCCIWCSRRQSLSSCLPEHTLSSLAAVWTDRHPYLCETAGNVSAAAASGSGMQWREVNFWQYLLLENSDSIWRLMRWEWEVPGARMSPHNPEDPCWGGKLGGHLHSTCQRLASKLLQCSAGFPRLGKYSGLVFIVNFRYTCPCCSSTHPLHTQQNLLLLIFISTSALLNQN